MAAKRIGSGNAKRRRRRPVEDVARPVAKADDLDELYVDDAPIASASMEAAPSPQSKGRQKKRSSGRAADRRRARGDAPVELAGPATRTSMRREGQGPEEENSDAPTSISRRRRNLDGSARVDTARVSMPAGTLHCVKGPEEGLVLQLIEGEYTIGRGRDNNFVLKDIAASRQHLRLVVDGTAVLAVDLGSGNGTRINGKRIKEHELRTGDRVEIGNSVLEFQSAHRENTQQVEGYDDATVPPPSDVERTAPPAPPMSDEDDGFVPVDATMPPPVEAAPRDQVLAAAAALAAELDGPPRDEASLPRTTMSRTRPSNPTQRVPAIESSLGTLGNEKDSSAGLRAAVPPDLWADGETATRMPNVAELLGPEEARRIEAARRKQAPSSTVRREPQGVSRQKPKRQGRGLVVVLSMFVVLLLVAAGLGGYWVFFRVPGPSDPVAQTTDDNAQVAIEYAALLEKASSALAGGDFSGGRTYAEEALRLKPDDAAAKNILEQALKAEKAASKAAAASDVEKAAGVDKSGEKTAESASGDKAAGEKDPGGEAGDKDKVAAVDDKAGEGPKAGSTQAKSAGDGPKSTDKKDAATKDGKTDVAAKAEVTKDTKKATSTKATKTSKKKKVVKKKKKRVKKRTPKKRSRAKGMTAEEAEKSFKQAIRLLRSDDFEQACALLNKVATKAPSDSPWKVKAKANLRRCE